MLCISNSKQVICKPFAGWNQLFWCFTSFPSQTETTKEQIQQDSFTTCFNTCGTNSWIFSKSFKNFHQELPNIWGSISIFNVFFRHFWVFLPSSLFLAGKGFKTLKKMILYHTNLTEKVFKKHLLYFCKYWVYPCFIHVTSVQGHRVRQYTRVRRKIRRAKWSHCDRQCRQNRSFVPKRKGNPHHTVNRTRVL